MGRISGSPLTADPITNIVRGLIPGQRIMRGIGERAAVGITASGEDIWRGNELAALPTGHEKIPTPAEAGESITIKSESNDDTAGGTGIRTVEVLYLDAAGVEQIEILDMNGTTGATMVATDVRFIQDIDADTVGSNGAAVGHVYAHKTGDATRIYSMIEAGGNKSLVPRKMVPAGKTLIMHEWDTAEGKNKRVIVRIDSDCDDQVPSVRHPGVFMHKSASIVNQSSSGQILIAYSIPEFSIVTARAYADAINAEVTVHWWGVLVDA